MRPDEYRTVRYFHQFFNHWAVNLEKKVYYRFLWWKWERWHVVCKNVFDEHIPHGWKEFNIVDHITIKNLTTC